MLPESRMSSMLGVWKTGGVKCFEGSKALDSAVLVAEDCDVLIRAVVGGVLNPETAKDVRAKFIVEAANHPKDIVAAEGGGSACARDHFCEDCQLEVVCQG